MAVTLLVKQAKPATTKKNADAEGRFGSDDVAGRSCRIPGNNEAGKAKHADESYHHKTGNTVLLFGALPLSLSPCRPLKLLVVPGAFRRYARDE